MFAIRCLLAAALVATLTGCPSDDGKPNGPPMPLNPKRADLYKYYKLGWLSDGYPGRMTDKGLVEHPIYGPYVIIDYLQSYRTTKDYRYVEAAKKVADAGIARMSDFKGALVFYYHPDGGLSTVPGKFYSALTQARWLDALAKLHSVSGDQKYAEVNRRIAKSLSIPTSEGGVVEKVEQGLTIEEYPHEIPLFTLNGWLSALNILIAYANTEDDLDAKALAAENVKALAAMLPMYDVPEIYNSRYQLTNSVRIRLSGERVVDAKIDIPGYGVHGLGDTKKTGTQWTNYLKDSGSTQILNAVMSYASAPKPNRIQLETAHEGVVKVEISASIYNPSTTSLPTKSWVEVGTVQTKNNKAVLDIPWDKAYLVAYPTAFTKKIGDKKQNVYHRLHVVQLQKLYKNTGNEIFNEYAKKWDTYFPRWKDIPEYQDPEVSLERFEN
jgi:hypothetical protein